MNCAYRGAVSPVVASIHVAFPYRVDPGNEGIRYPGFFALTRSPFGLRIGSEAKHRKRTYGEMPMILTMLGPIFPGWTIG